MNILTPTNVALFATAIVIDRFGATLTVVLAVTAALAALVVYEFVRGLYTPNK